MCDTATLLKLSKNKLLEKCAELGLKKYKSKNKADLITLITATQIDFYTYDVLLCNFNIYRTYAESRRISSIIYNLKYQEPIMPNDVSDNIIKFIIRQFSGQLCYSTKTGQIFSAKFGRIECKTITHIKKEVITFLNGETLDTVCFLDLRNWLDNRFILYIANVSGECGQQLSNNKRISIKWESIKYLSEQIYDGTLENALYSFF